MAKQILSGRLKNWLGPEIENVTPEELKAHPLPAWLDPWLEEHQIPRELWQGLKRYHQLCNIAKTRKLRELKAQGIASFEEWERLEQVKQYKRVMLERGVPSRFLDAYLGDSDSRPALVAMWEFYQEHLHQGRCLILCGGPGIGKTWAMATAARALTEEEKRWSWVYAGELFAQINPGNARLNPYIQTPILFIDDLGTESQDRYIQEKVDAMIYFRHGNRLATVISTNLKPDELRSRYGDRVIDRLKEWLPEPEIRLLGGKSLRGSPAEREVDRGASKLG